MKQNLKVRNVVCSNVHYFYYEAARFFENMKEAGWTSVEFYLGTPHIFVDGNLIDDFNQIPLLASEHRVKITDIHPETISFRYNLCSLDRMWNQSSLRAYRNTICYAARIGAESVNTNLIGAFRDLDQKRIFANVAKNIIQLADYAKQKHILLTLETESPKYEGFICNLEQMQRLDAEVNNPALWFGINMDALKDAGETLNDWENAFGERIRYLRFSSIEDFQKIWPKLCGTVWEQKRILFFFNDDHYLEQPFMFDRKLREAIDGTD